MNLLRALARRDEARSTGIQALTFDDYVSWFGFNGVDYPIMQGQTMRGDVEEPAGDFASLAQQAYKRNGVVFACMLVRMLLFSEARFQFRQLRGGQPGQLFGTAALERLERPWPNGTTGDLLARMEQDSSLAGNSITVRLPDRLARLRPDWVTIMIGVDGQPAPDAVARWDVDAEVIGYMYVPGGKGRGGKPQFFLAEEVAHYAPIPDPEMRFRGMSWLRPVITEFTADQAATQHKLNFFKNGATPNMIVKFDPAVVTDTETFNRWTEAMESKYAGLSNAYRTMYLAAVTDAQVVGANLRQIDFKATQGAGETRIAAAAGVPAVIVGLSEGLESATYSNFAQARRRFADGTMRPLWARAAGALASITDVPAGSELWYDERHVAFLREDEKDTAEIIQTQAVAIRQLVDAGYESSTVVDAVTSADLGRLAHTGLFSVQLQPAGVNPQVVAAQRYELLRRMLELTRGNGDERGD